MAQVNLDRIESAYADRLKTEEYPGDYIFTLGYNHTHEYALDFAEVVYQWSTEFGESANASE